MSVVADIAEVFSNTRVRLVGVGMHRRHLYNDKRGFYDIHELNLNRHKQVA